MTNLTESRKADELAQLRELFTEIQTAIHVALDDIRNGDSSAARTLSANSQLLHKVAVQIQTQKEQFHDRHGPDIAEGEFDLEQARFDIGCKLARIATCCDAGRLSCAAERGGAEGSAASV